MRARSEQAYTHEELARMGRKLLDLGLAEGSLGDVIFGEMKRRIDAAGGPPQETPLRIEIVDYGSRREGP